MTGQEAREPEREALIAELKAAAESLRYDEEEWGGSEVAEAWDESRSLLTRAAQALARKHPEPEITEWVATLEALLAEVYTILKPLVVEKSHGASSPLLKAFGLLDQQDFTRRVPVGEGEQ